MKNLKCLSLLTFVACIIMMTSCSKGNAGPAGPAGPAGDTGAAGVNGTNGTDSVLYSNWTTLSMAGSIDANNDTSYSESITANAITSNILNNGVVLTYLQQIDQNGDTLIFNAATVLTESYYVGRIFLYSGVPAGYTNASGYDYSGYNYRFIAIPGSIATSRFPGYTQQQIKSLSYQSVLKMANIPAGKVVARNSN
ncbi:MAG TPA: hypothetical protein VF939_09040 [Puia sp.]